MATEQRAQGSTRTKILQLLRRSGELTAGELSCALGVGAVGVRQHLATLCQEELVVAVGVRRGLGRPSHLYSLTEKAKQLFPKTYECIALDALGHIAATGGAAQIDELFATRQQRLAAQYRARLAGESVEARVAALAAILNEQGYMCEWDRSDDGAITLTEYNCPIDCVAREFPQACACELRLYEDLIGARLVQISTIAGGAASCQYCVAGE
jgi:predicted ArsR family transcriptional regulator